MSSAPRKPHLTRRVVRGLKVLSDKPPLIDARKSSDEGAALRWAIRTYAWYYRKKEHAKQQRKEAKP